MPTKNKSREVIRHNADDAPVYYSNNVEIRGSQWDLRFSFGELIEVAEDKLEVKVVANIYMSPQHAKTFAKVMLANIEQYEKAVGEIPDFGTEIEAKTSSSEAEQGEN